jgi:hypothetical protein
MVKPHTATLDSVHTLESRIDLTRQVKLLLLNGSIKLFKRILHK